LEFEAEAVAEEGHLRLVLLGFDDAADAGDGDVGNGAGDFGGGAGGKKELVVFAAVEEGGDLGAVVEGGGEGVERELGEVELGGNVGGGAEVGEVGGEAVAEIDAGCSEAAAEQGLADGEARLGEEVGMIADGLRVAEFAGRGGQCCEFGSSSAESSGAVEEVARASRRTAKGAASGCGSEEDDVGEDVIGGGLGGVAAGERDVMEAGEGEQAVEKSVEPAGVACGGFG